MPLDEPDAVAQAIAANHFGAHAYVGFEASSDAVAVAHFYKVPTFESIGGRALAELIAQELQTVDGVQPTVAGMRLPVLRETRMPAVLLSIGPVRVATDTAPQLTAAVLRAFELWILRAS